MVKWLSERNPKIRGKKTNEEPYPTNFTESDTAHAENCAKHNVT